jgi:hypothetical protein
MSWKVGGRDSEKCGRWTVDGLRREERQESDAKATGRRATTGEASPGAMCLAMPHLKAGLGRPNTRTSERSEGQRGWPVSCPVSTYNGLKETTAGTRMCSPSCVNANLDAQEMVQVGA